MDQAGRGVQTAWIIGKKILQPPRVINTPLQVRFNIIIQDMYYNLHIQLLRMVCCTIEFARTNEKKKLCISLRKVFPPITLLTRVGKLDSIHILPPPPRLYTLLTKHFHPTQVCIWPFSNIEWGNGSAATYPVGTCIMVVSHVFAHFPAQLVHGCNLRTGMTIWEENTL